MSNVVRFLGESHRGMSPAIWGHPGKLLEDQWFGKCVFFYDDFVAPTRHASVSASGGYYTYQDVGVTIQGCTAAHDISTNTSLGELGVLQVAGNDADNDEGHVQFGDDLLYRIGNPTSNTGKVMFECRLKMSNITNNGIAWFAGLGGTLVAANHLVDDTGVLLTTGAFIGFRNLQDDGDSVDVVYQAASQTLQSVKDAYVNIVADTYYKMGFVYNPDEIDAAKKIKFYWNGVDIGSYVTTTNIDAATFPESVALVPQILTKVGTASLTDTFTIDWVASSQYLSTN